MQDVLDAYSAAATPTLIGAYEALAVETVYAPVLDLFPQQAAQIADIGAGTGRDAAWFAERGHGVLAVEPVAALREAGRRLHPSERILWLDDRLPRLAQARRFAPFGLVLLGGVWQHLPPDAQGTALPRLAAMAEYGGRVILSLRHGPAAGGRRVFPIEPEATVANAWACGLRLIRRRETGSIQPGNQAMEVWWTWLAFEKEG